MPMLAQKLCGQLVMWGKQAIALVREAYQKFFAPPSGNAKQKPPA
jgi:hypothetical protein